MCLHCVLETSVTIAYEWCSKTSFSHHRGACSILWFRRLSHWPTFEGPRRTFSLFASLWRDDLLWSLSRLVPLPHNFRGVGPKSQSLSIERSSLLGSLTDVEWNFGSYSLIAVEGACSLGNGEFQVAAIGLDLFTKGLYSLLLINFQKSRLKTGTLYSR